MYFLGRLPTARHCVQVVVDSINSALHSISAEKTHKQSVSDVISKKLTEKKSAKCLRIWTNRSHPFSHFLLGRAFTNKIVHRLRICKYMCHFHCMKRRDNSIKDFFQTKSGVMSNCCSCRLEEVARSLIIIFQMIWHKSMYEANKWTYAIYSNQQMDVIWNRQIGCRKIYADSSNQSMS